MLKISSAKIATEAGRDSVTRAHDAAEDIKNQFESIVLMLAEVNKKFDTFIKTPGATPGEIRGVANDVSTTIYSVSDSSELFKSLNK